LLLFRREIAQKMHLPTNNGGIDADFGFSDRAGQDQRIPVACLFFRRAVKPARKNRFFVQGTGLPRQNDKHRLGDFLGQLGIAHPPQRCRINEAGMAGNQRAKAVSDCWVAYSRTSAMSSVVIHSIHARPKPKGDKEFSVFGGKRSWHFGQRAIRPAGN